MIVAYSRQDYPSEVLSLYRQMLGDGVRPDSSTFTASLKACASTLDLENGEEIWCKAVDCGYECDVFVGSSVLSLYAKSGKMDEAVLVCKKMPRKELVCWTTMLSGFVQIGKPIEAVEMFRGTQREGIEFDGVGAGLCKSWGLETECFRSWVYDSERSSYGCYGSNQPCADVCKNGHLELASQVFDMMPCKNTISWGALISGFAQNGFAGRALEMLVDMQGSGFEPDLVSLVSALIACSQVGLL